MVVLCLLTGMCKTVSAEKRAEFVITEEEDLSCSGSSWLQ